MAEKLAQTLPYELTLYVKKGREGETAAQSYQQLSTLVRKIFYDFDGLIFIMATGIVVRVIAPCVQNKRIDPAVVTLDERGKFVISLLSGHIGGANELTNVVAQAITAQPVITTATDVNHLPAVDIMAVKMKAKLEPLAALKMINAAIVNGDDVKFFFDRLLPQYDRQMAEKMGVKLYDLTNIGKTDYSAAVAVTDRQLNIERPHIFVRPPTLVVGVGCRKDTAPDEILKAVKECCEATQVSMASIAVLASTVKKQHEPGLLQAAQSLGVKIIFYANEQLSESIAQHQLEISNFVEENIGVGNVCEAAAMAGTQIKKLIRQKTRYHKVTVAIARVSYGL